MRRDEKAWYELVSVTAQFVRAGDILSASEMSCFDGTLYSPENSIDTIEPVNADRLKYRATQDAVLFTELIAVGGNTGEYKSNLDAEIQLVGIKETFGSKRDLELLSKCAYSEMARWRKLGIEDMREISFVTVWRVERWINASFESEEFEMVWELSGVLDMESIARGVRKEQ